MPIVICDFYVIINLYTIRLIVVKNIDVETISRKRNFNTESNDNFYLYGVIIDEWNELEFISFSCNFFSCFFSKIKFIYNLK